MPPVVLSQNESSYKLVHCAEIIFHTLFIIPHSTSLQLTAEMAVVEHSHLRASVEMQKAFDG